MLRQAGAIRAAGAIDIIPGVIGRKPAGSVPINQYASRSDGAKRLLPMSRDRVEGRGNPARSGIETFSSERAVVQAPSPWRLPRGPVMLTWRGLWPSARARVSHPAFGGVFEISASGAHL